MSYANSPPASLWDFCNFPPRSGYCRREGCLLGKRKYNNLLISAGALSAWSLGRTLLCIKSHKQSTHLYIKINKKPRTKHDSFKLIGLSRLAVLVRKVSEHRVFIVLRCRLTRYEHRKLPSYIGHMTCVNPTVTSDCHLKKLAITLSSTSLVLARHY